MTNHCKNVQGSQIEVQVYEKQKATKQIDLHLLDQTLKAALFLLKTVFHSSFFQKTLAYPNWIHQKTKRLHLLARLELFAQIFIFRFNFQNS